MCYSPPAGEPTKIYHPTTTSAGLSYLCTRHSFVMGTDCGTLLFIKKKKERNSLKLENLYLRKGSVSWTRLCEVQVWDKVGVLVFG